MNLCRYLQLGSRLLQFVVLQLQFDLMNLQFVDETLHLLCRMGTGGLRPARFRFQSVLRPCPQRRGGRALPFLHPPASWPDCVARSVASSVLAAVMSTKVITTPSMRLSSVR